jgi:hypothetical protein
MDGCFCNVSLESHCLEAEKLLLRKSTLDPGLNLLDGLFWREGGSTLFAHGARLSVAGRERDSCLSGVGNPSNGQRCAQRTPIRRAVSNPQGLAWLGALLASASTE